MGFISHRQLDFLTQVFHPEVLKTVPFFRESGVPCVCVHDSERVRV